MQKSESSQPTPEESIDSRTSERESEVRHPSQVNNASEEDTLAATQVHFPTPSDALANYLAQQVDPFAETRAVKVENKNAVEIEEALAASRLSKVTSEAVTTTESENLAATLPIKPRTSKPSSPAEAGEETLKMNLVEDPHLEATQATPLNAAGGGQRPPEQPIRAAKKQPSPLRWVILLGILGLIGVAFLSAFAGYASGISARRAAEATQAGLVAKEQYELALQEIASKDYLRARQRLEYVIQIAPDYPGAAEKLAEVIFEASITATPTLAPTPTVSPTPDLRGAEERLEAAKQQIFNSQWTAAIDTLLLLRKAEPNFQPAVVDDLLYLAYRNSGRDKILKEGNLEGGIYDLTLAEKFGPLDTETKGLQNWARLYLLGASYWDVDWGQVVYYFAQVAPAVPNLRDGTGWTATDRYRIALGKYAEQLLARKEWCAAMETYQQALS
ncbi:MAG: hypothetical protein N3D16_12920, partial [Anaerolineales bacterium]|nr:hypothetical protein [Anaerolineales bacterium]